MEKNLANHLSEKGLILKYIKNSYNMRNRKIIALESVISLK